MTLEYQSDLLKYLCQYKEARKFIDWLEPEVFDLDEQYTTFTLLKSFVTKYKQQPSLGNLLQHFETNLASQKSPVTKEVKSILEEAIREAFEIFVGSTQHIRQELLKEYQKKSLANLMIKNADKLTAASPDALDSLFTDIDKIKRITSLTGDEEQNRGQFLLADHKPGTITDLVGHPTFLKAMNKMTTARGFFKPQLIIIMGGPKSFKTGTLINIAVGYVRDGFKVYYADGENDQNRIKDRAKQCMLEATWDEYRSGELDDTLNEQVSRYKYRGGDFIAEYYPAYTKTMLDVEAELDRLKEEYNWEPDIICYDYLDLFKPEDKTVKERRLQIQHVYFDAIRLQKRKNVIGFSLSQINKEAVDKPVIDMKAFSEDFGKAMNAHAGFAICSTEDEKKANVARIIPVMQRDGVPQSSGHTCFISIDAERMTIKEIRHDEWKLRVEAVQSEAAKTRLNNKTTKTKASARGVTPTLKDE